MKVDSLLVDKLSDLVENVNHLYYRYVGSTFMINLSKQYKGVVDVLDVDNTGRIECKLRLYRRASGLLAHEIGVTLSPGELDEVYVLSSNPYSRGVRLLDLSVIISQRGSLRFLWSLGECVQAIQRNEEKLAFIKLLEEFGIWSSKDRIQK